MTRKRMRPITAEERALFEETVREAMLLLPQDAAVPRANRERKSTSPTGGLDGRTAERLRRGLIEPEARLDLHGFTEERAHQALARFLANAQANHYRLVLVVTGKGTASGPEDASFDLQLAMRRRGVLKSLVPRWLKEPHLAPFVAGTSPAHRRHGGEGALYIYLRKGRTRS